MCSGYYVSVPSFTMQCQAVVVTTTVVVPSYGLVVAVLIPTVCGGGVVLGNGGVPFGY